MELEDICFLFLDINECYSLPCFNGGGCTDLINNFQCSCVPGYTGVQCESGDEYFIRCLIMSYCPNVTSKSHCHDKMSLIWLVLIFAVSCLSKQHLFYDWCKK